MNTSNSNKAPVAPSRPQAPARTRSHSPNTKAELQIINDMIQDARASRAATSNAKKRKAMNSDTNSIVPTQTANSHVEAHPLRKDVSDSVPRPATQPPLPKAPVVSNDRPGISAAPPSILAPPGSLDARGNLRVRTLDFQEWGTDMVTLSVTDQNGPYSILVHKNLACYHSEVIRDHFNSQPQSQNMELDNTTKATASALVRYMYKDTLWTISNYLPFNATLPSNATLAALWILSAELSMPVLQNASIMAIDQRNKMDKVVATECLLWIYKNTEASDPLRRLLVDYITDWEAEKFEKEVVEWPTRYSPEILQDIAIASMRKRLGPKMQRNMCAFLVPVPEMLPVPKVLPVVELESSPEV